MRIKEGNKESNILEAAIKVFAEHGFHNAKIHQIAECARVATGSVYVYYKNKETLLLKIFEQIWGKLFVELKLIKERDDINAVEKFDGMIDLIFDILTGKPALALVFVNEQIHLQRNPNETIDLADKFLELGETIVKEGIQAKLFNPNIDVRIFRMYIFGGVRHLLHQWANNPQQYPLNSIRKNVKFISKRGLLK